MKSMKNIVNIINFVRGIEPRPGRNIDLYQPVREQIRLMRENDLTGTFLLQYDALIDAQFRTLMQSCLDFCEVGLWLEIVEPLVTAVGEKWNGRYSWDWYNDVGFLIGYEPEVRCRLIDECMLRFKETYGFYPKSVGSWHIDAFSMRYLAERYQVRACCICRDQVGTDGYTLQGGYYNQAYYPSRFNMFCPAQTRETQIDLPVFRMLGSDPISAYDFQIFPYRADRRCPTMEPAQMGGDCDFASWLVKEIFSGNGISFQYMQIGQENSFGWERMEAGINNQFRAVRALRDEKKLEVMTLGEAGEWYCSQYSATPPSTVTALSGFEQASFRSVWYNSRYYRCNLFWDNGIVRLRDLYLFRERYEEHYLRRRCNTHACEYRNLPIMDGVIGSDSQKNLYAGIYLAKGEMPIRWDCLTYTEEGNCAKVILRSGHGTATVIFSESQAEIRSDIPELTLIPLYDRDCVYGKTEVSDVSFANHNNKHTCITYLSKVSRNGNRIDLLFDSFFYHIRVLKGWVNADWSIASDAGSVKVDFAK